MVPKFEDFFFPCLLCLSDGNIHNQITLRKYVVDYIHIDVKLLRKIIFNISDVCIIIGGCISMLANVIRFLKEE